MHPFEPLDKIRSDPLTIEREASSLRVPGKKSLNVTTPEDGMTISRGSACSRGQQGRLGAGNVLAWSIWFGLSAGLLEVATRVLCRAVDPTKRLYLMSRHFVWLIPLANMLFFLALGLLLAGITKLWPRLGAWLSPRLLCALAIQPMLMVAVPRILPAAWFILALGIASRLVPWLESQPAKPRQLLLAWSLPALLGLDLIVAGSVFAGDWLKQARESRRALPAAGSPNVLFIVLDTVRADHLSLYGYGRPTTPTLERLAKNGIRFDRARATAPWTLPSHASFFTGRWPHELGVEWLTPLRPGPPLLAEYMGSRGYATAGFVANTGYCSYDTGLARGFTHYEDYILKRLAPLQMPIVVKGLLGRIFEVSTAHDPGALHYVPELVERWFYSGIRKDAESINRAFLDWLSRRPEQTRPFFVFLNYLDAHAPYKLPEGAQHRFGHKPRSREEIRVIHDGWDSIDKLTLPRYYQTMARDAYDSCLAYLDEQLGVLFDELQRRALLDDTLVVITSDHGEGLGEHDLFDHGESLYSTELDVSLLILLPRKGRTARVVRQVVSLRDLPATIVDLVGQGAGSPFPGHSLADVWRDSHDTRSAVSVAFSELFAPSPRKTNHGRSPADRGAMISVAEGDFVYIRNEGDGAEELFNKSDDPHELSNRRGVDALKPVLEQLRAHVVRFRQPDPGGMR
jgi:arylsulfatase A-like enzyme